MDLFTKINMKLFLSQIRKISEKTRVVTEIKDENNTHMNSFKLISEWRFTTLRSTVLNLVNKLYRIIPVSDHPVYASNLEDSVREIYGDLIDIYKPESWKNPTSDQCLKNIIRQGLGSHMIKRYNKNYTIDLSYMEQFDVRPGILKYGSRIVFDKKFNLISITYQNTVYTPENPEWERAKFIFRSSLITANVIQTHGIVYHMLYASNVASSLSELSKDDPLRILMTPFQYGNMDTATKARRILFEGKSYLKRMFGFTDSALEKFCEYSLFTAEYKPFPEVYKSLGHLVNHSPYYTDGILVWKTVNTFVKEYFQKHNINNDFDKRLFYKTHGKVHIKSQEELITFITEYIFMSTAAHEIVGNSIFKYTFHPELCAMKIYENAPGNYSDVQTYHQVILLSVITSMLKLPKIMDDFTFLFPQEDHPLINKFQEDLTNLSIIIQIRNKDREPFIDMDPYNLEISMSA